MLHHLLINREMYEENGNMKSKLVKFDRTSSPRGYRGVHIAPTFGTSAYIAVIKNPFAQHVIPLGDILCQPSKVTFILAFLGGKSKMRNIANHVKPGVQNRFSN